MGAVTRLVGSLCFLLSLAPLIASSGDDAILDAGSGLQWRIHAASAQSWGLGQPLLHGKSVSQPLTDAFAFWRNPKKGIAVPVIATSIIIDPDNTAATFNGSATLPAGGPGGKDTDGTVSLRLQLCKDSPAASFSVEFFSNIGISDSWQLVVKWQPDLDPTGVWVVSGYPYAGNSTSVSTKLDYMGWPGYWLYRPDASVVAFFAISAHDDYNNPTTWSGSTEFVSGDGEYQLAPQYHFGGQPLPASTFRQVHLHLLFSDSGEMLAAVRGIVPALLKLDNYSVIPMKYIRSPSEMLACFVNARRTTPMWKSTPNGTAYQLQDIASFIYLGTTPESAYFEYLLYLKTGDMLWRTRAFAQMDFWLQGQNLDGTSRHFGAVETTYNLPSGPYNSDDREVNKGWKIDINSHMARYALLLGEAVHAAEGTSPDAWRVAATRAAEWVYRMAQAQALCHQISLAQGGSPGSAGFPQRIDPTNDQPSPTVTSGRTMNALRVFQRLLESTSEYNFTALLQTAEQFLVEHIEGVLYFAGQHPDEPYYTYEQDSVWEMVEYWLDVYNETGASDALERAVGDTYVALMMLCPKDLPWVGNPTQMAADEQTAYAQYTVYTYHNRKWLALQRLATVTGTALFQQLADRLLQLNAFTQVVSGAPSDVGGFHEAIADPWLARGGGFNFVGSVYLNELALDLALQLLLAGTLPTPGYTQCHAGQQ